MMKSRRITWAGHVARMGKRKKKKKKKKNAYRILVGEQEGKRTLGRLRRRWVYNIKLDLKERGRDELIWLRIGTSGGLL
jgi:hypothetical protein